MKFWGRFLALLFLVVCCDGAYAIQCRHFTSLQVSTKFQPQKPLRFMSLNTLNLYLHKGKYLWTDSGLEKVNQDHLPNQKPERHTRGLADVIKETQPDFLMLQEVEGYESLDRFSRRYLDDAYQTFPSQTNDDRGIGIALLVRKGVGVTVKNRSYIYRKWINKKGNEEAVFARNFPVYEIYLEGADEPKLVLAGVHYKSRIDRGNDPKSFYKRQREVDESVKIIQEVRDEYPNTQMIVMGDFNSSPEQKELSAFYNELKMVDAHADPDTFQDPEGMGRSTFVFFPHGKEKKKRAFDLALMTPGLAPSLLSASVYRYKDSVTGKVLPMPKTIDERNEKPSDHYPILFDLAPGVLYPDDNAGD